MPELNLVQKKARLSLWEIVKLQLVTHFYLHQVKMSDSELDCLTFLAIKGEQQLSLFCEAACAEEVFMSSQTVRNCLTDLCKKGFVLTDGKKNKKKVKVNPELELTTEGNILLDFKFGHVVQS